MTQSFVKRPDNGPHSALSGLGVLASEQAPVCKLFHVDDCMYVAANTAEEAAAHVKAECGDGCGDSVREVGLAMPVTTANVDDGEKATPDTMTTAGALIEEHIKHGGTLPYTICFDAGM